ncbi:MAG: 4Fe-4S dicluster domain-containing protein [Chloroflexi bacterium]|nr:4Fe-4S dicluster domain-containing protein [Chloroflexota bacterium]
MNDDPQDLKQRVNRRQLLKLLGTVGVTPIAARLLPDLLPHLSDASPAQDKTESRRIRQWVLVFDLRKCEGCVTIGEAPQCIEACNAEHFVPKGQEWIKVFEMESPGGHSFFLPRPCMQCENPPCLNVCPVGATYMNEEGVVLVNHERCIGCRMCMAACPYAARVFNWEQPENPPGATFATYSPEYPVPHRQGTVEKCMLCAHRTMDGKLPACVEGCPMYAIYLGDLTEDIATNGKDVVKLSLFLASNSAYRLKEELGTRPRVFYIPGHGQESGHDIDEHRPVIPARSWQEQGVSLDDPQGGH